MSYEFSIENFGKTYSEIEPLYREHYGEMVARLLLEGVEMPPYNPRLDQYVMAGDGGWLLTYILRDDKQAVGYCNVYLTHDMHNRQLIAQEDTIFVTKAHRNGVGKKLVQYVLADLKTRGVTRAFVSAMTDLRVEKLWSRMGFKKLATQMVYLF